MYYHFYRGLELDGLALFIFLIVTLCRMFAPSNKKEIGIRFMVLSLLAYLLLYYGTYLLPFSNHPHHYWYYFFINMAISFSMSMIFLPGNISGKFLYVLFITCFVQLYKMIWSPLYNLETVISMPVYAALDIISILLLLAILIMLYRLFEKSIPVIRRDIGPKLVLLIYFPVGLLIFYALNLLHLPFVVKYSDAIMSLIILPALPILYILFISVVNSYEEQRRLDMALTETQAQVYRYRYSLELDERIKKERHELKNNYLYIRTLLNEKRYDDLEKYLDTSIGQKMDEISDVSTGNMMIDYIINRKIIEARKQNIKIYTEIILPKELPVNEEKFCTIFLNLFNNAQEACQNVENPDIQIVMKCIKNYLSCEIRNKVDPETIRSNRDLHTTKPDSENHGLGLRIVRDAIEDCDGIFQTGMSGNYFLSKFMLPLM